MHTKIWQLCALVLALTAMAFYGTSVYARDGGKGVGGNDGGMGMGRAFNGGNFSMQSKGFDGIHQGFKQGMGNFNQGQNFNTRNFVDRGRNFDNLNGNRSDFANRGIFDKDWNRFYSHNGRGWWWGLGLNNFYGYSIYPYRSWDYYPYDYYTVDPYYYDYYGDNVYTTPDNSAVQDSEISQQQAQPLPTSKDLARLTDEQLHSLIAGISDGFSRELGQFGTGDTWVRYFDLNTLKSLAPNSQETIGAALPAVVAPSVVDKKVITDVLTRMDSTIKDDKFSAVSDLWGFKALHTALIEAVKSSEERQAGVIKGQAEILSQTLKQVPTGEGWQKYFSLDTLEKITSNENLRSNDQIQHIAAKFDRVAQNPEYKSLTQMPGFMGLHSTLNKVLEVNPGGANVGRLPPPPLETTR